MNSKTDDSRSELPVGTVTFLFTDIECSTKLLHQLGEGYVTLLADHHRLMREVFAQLGGDVEGPWRAGLLDGEAAGGLWMALPRTADKLATDWKLDEFIG